MNLCNLIRDEKPSIPIVSSCQQIDPVAVRLNRPQAVTVAVLAARRISHALEWQEALHSLTLPHSKTCWILTDPVLNTSQVRQLGELARSSEVAVTADHFRHIEWIRDAAIVAEKPIAALLQVDTGSGVGGIRPGHDTCDLSLSLQQIPEVPFGGLMLQYPGRSLLANRHDWTVQALSIIETCHQLIQRDIPKRAGTVFVDFPEDLQRMLPAGTLLQKNVGTIAGTPPRPTSGSLEVSVRSRPSLTTCVLAAGRETPGMPGNPTVSDPSGALITAISDHHMILRLQDRALDLRIGDCVRLEAGL